MALFEFPYCPDRQVPKTVPPQTADVISLNGWDFSAKPSVPYRRKFKVALHGLRWYLQADGTYDSTTNIPFNARNLELFYETHQKHNPFSWPHPHLGDLVVRFHEPVEVPPGVPNSGGFIEAFEITLIEHSPAWA